MSAEGLERSEKIVGQLRKVVLTPDGKVVDGFHRLDVNPEWGTETWENIKTEEDYWKVRAHLNYTRRNATENRREKLKIINSLAEYYVGQGLKIDHRDPDDRSGYQLVQRPKNQILEAVQKALDGAIPASWIRDELDKKYRQKTPIKEPSPDKKPYKTTPEQAIRSRFSGREEQGEIIIEDFKEDIREQVKAEVKAEAREEAKEELRRDPKFLIETAATVEQVLPTIVEKVVSEEGFHVPTVTEQQAQELVEAVRRTDREFEEKQADPAVQERAKFYKMWLAMGTVVSLEDELFCPECGEPASSHLVFKCHPEDTLANIMRKLQEKLEE